MKTGQPSKGAQRQLTTLRTTLSRLDPRGTMLPVMITNLTARADIKTRGAQITFLVTSLQGVDSFVLLRNFSRDPGSAKAIQTWSRASLVANPQVLPITVTYADADQSISGQIAYYWIKVVPSATKTIDNVFLYGPQQYDASLAPIASKITTDFCIGQAYTPTTSPITAVTGGVPNTATVNIAAFAVQAPFGQVLYNSGAITPLLDATLYYIYCDDPTFKGGPQTYIASTLNPDVTANQNRIYVGKVTTPAFGGGGTGGDGGGGGPCFSGNTSVAVQNGFMPIGEIEAGMNVMTRLGWRKVSARIEHDYKGSMYHMGGGELVTPDHRFRREHTWVPAREVFRDVMLFQGKVFNLSIEGGSDDEHCYTLANGWVVHNQRK